MSSSQPEAKWVIYIRPAAVVIVVQVVGTIRSEVAQELGLSPDVQVAPGSGDNQMSALGAGAVHEGTWVMSLGTSGTLFGLSTKPVLDPSGAVSPFCDATGSWLPLLCTMNCTTVTEEVTPSRSWCNAIPPNLCPPPPPPHPPIAGAVHIFCDVISSWLLRFCIAKRSTFRGEDVRPVVQSCLCI